MITGFNTDVEFQGVVYHVQTEDKGVETPLILSLVYNRGTILASKRSPYDDLLSAGLDESLLAARLQKQHKTICAAVRAGRIEDLKKMAAKDVAARKTESIVTSPEKTIPNSLETFTKITAERAEVSSVELNFNKIPVNTEQQDSLTAPVLKLDVPKPEIKPSYFEKPLNTDRFAEKIDRAKAKTNNQVPAELPDQTALLNANTLQPVQSALVNSEQNDFSIPKPRHELGAQFGINALEKEIIIDAVEIIEEEMLLPAEAVAVVSELVASAPKIQPLKIEFLTPMALKSGERKTVNLVVCRGKQANGVGAAQIMVKILGSSFRPLIFHAKTDAKGVATVHLQLPHFRAGRAALLVRAMHGGEQVELRRAILHG